MTTHQQQQQQQSEECHEILSIKPHINEEDAKLLATKLYNINTINKIEKLCSYLDQNFKIECCITTKSDDDDDETKINSIFNLKILNSDDSKFTQLIKAEHKVMFHLRSNNFKCPTPVHKLNNREYDLYYYIDDNNEIYDCNYVSIDANSPADKRNLDLNSKYYVVRLLDFIPGKPISEVSEYTETLLFNVGCYAGRLDFSLKDFYDEIYESRDCIWHLNKLYKYAYRVDYVRNEERKSVLKEIIDDFCKNFMNENNLCRLRKGMLHGDFNESNILVDANDETNVCGILDFGDSNYSYYVFEVAVCALYMMLDAVNKCKLTQIDIAAIVIAGYMSKFKLTNYEFLSIIKCIKARIAQSLINGAYTSRVNPDNSYVTVTQQSAWSLLVELNKQNNDCINKYWANILKNKYNIYIE